MARPNRNAALDPEREYHEIYRNLVLYEFPWDLNQSLSFALFRTYAVPSIGRLLAATGEFTTNTQKRYDDTALLLEAPLVEGFASQEGRDAVRRINRMHRAYDISNEDMRYVLSTFVVVPWRWIERYGWRRLTGTELRASVLYYRDLGRHLNITDLPESLEDFETLLDDYEREHFAFDPGARRVADATLALMATFHPRPVRPLMHVGGRALMDPPLLRAFGYAEPGAAVRWLVERALRARARVVALLPPRRRPCHIRDLGYLRSYPGGFRIPDLGTFPGEDVSRRPR